MTSDDLKSEASRLPSIHNFSHSNKLHTKPALGSQMDLETRLAIIGSKLVTYA